MDSLSDISLTVKTFERQQALERLLDSIDAQGYASCPVLIADDSQEPYRDAIMEKYGELVDEYVVLPFNSGVSKGRNELLKRVETTYFVLNDDDFVYGDITDLKTARRELVDHDLDILGGQVAEKQKSYRYDWIPKRVSNWIGLYSEHWEEGAWVADIKETNDGGVKLESYSDLSSLQPCDLALQFFVARTNSVRDVVGGWNPKLKSNGEHWEFFYRCKQAGLHVASSQQFGTYHVPEKNERYEQFRYGKKRDMITTSLKEHDFKYLEKEHRTYYTSENDVPQDTQNERAPMIGYVRRFIYRNFADRRSLKQLAGRRIVEALKRMVNARSLVTSKPFDEVFPEAVTNTAFGEKEIPHGDIRNLNVRSENRIDEQEGVYHRPRIFTSIVDDALICPSNNVVMNRDREVAKESINMRGRTELGLDRQALCRSQIDSIDGYATLLRGPAIGYWHAQLDSIPRVSLLRHETYRSLPTIKLLRPEGGPAVNVELEDFLVPKIAPPNCEIVEVPPDRLYSVENYVFTSFLTFPFSAYLPEFYLDLLRENVCPDRERRKSERIFISRQKAPRRNVLNEEKLSGLLDERGFNTYHLEDMHISEKVKLFYDAEIVVSPTSSGLASLLYTKDVPVVELFPMPEVVHPANYFLSLSLDNEHHYIPHDGDSLTSDFRANIEETIEKVDALLPARSRAIL